MVVRIIFNSLLHFQLKSRPDPTPITTQSDSSKRRPFPGPAGKKEPAGNLKPLDLQPLSPVSLTAQQIATQNERSLPLKEQLSANQILPLTPEKLYPVVLITPLPPGTKPDEYVKIPDKEAGIESSQKRNSMVNAETKQQRIISDEAVRRLQELTQELIEADDQLQLDASSDTGIEAARCFISTHHDDRELRTLTPAVQVKLESSLQKVISLGRFRDISPESLCRIQGLCEGALSSVEFSDFHVGLASTSNGESSWVHGVETFDLGLRSTRTILRIMAGDREEKEIYSEELLQSALRVIEKVFKSCIVPIVEARNTGPSSAIFETASTHKKTISQLSYDASKVIGLLVEILSKVEVSESVVTTLEFFAARLLFVENAHSEKESVLGIQKFESLRRTSMDMIAEIFSRYPDQRTFLIDEILTSLQKLPVNRPHARQYKLAEGKSVQLVSALMMRLIQTSANAVAAKRMGKKGDVSNASDSSEEDCAHHGTIDSYSESSDETSEEISSTRYSEAMRRLAKDANRLSDNAAKNAQYVIRFYVQRAITAPKTGDQPHRHLMDMFAEDLIVVLGLPEWPAAELLLRALLIRMIDIAENKKYNAPAKSMALELLGIMGSGISGLVASTQNKASVLENEDSAFGGYLRQLLEEYMDGKLENDELLGWEGPYRAVLEYFEQSGLGDKQIASAQGYILTQWAKSVASGNLKSSVATQNLARRLRKMLSNTKWVTSE